MAMDPEAPGWREMERDNSYPEHLCTLSRYAIQ